MKILITNISLIYSAGSELYTYDLTKYLSNNGHEVFVFSPSLGPVSEEISKLKNVTVTNNLEEIKDEKFDILHIHHNVNAYLVREYFPDVPALMVVHGVLPEFEQPPMIDLGISKYVAVSEEVREHLINNYDIPKSKIEIIRNWVNTEKFKKKSNINKTPKSVLVVSNHYPEEHRKIYEEVCKERGLDIAHVGLPENPVTNVEDYMNNADIVITLGRGAMEAMTLGRNVIVSDIHGMDGMLTSEMYLESIKNNLSGRRYARKVTKKNFERELDKYSLENGNEMEAIAKKNHDREQNIKYILEIYEEIVFAKVRLDKDFKKTLLEMKVLANASGLRESHIFHLNAQIKSLQSLKEEYLNEIHTNNLRIAKCEDKLNACIRKYEGELNTYKNSKIFKLAQIYWRIRAKIFKK